MKLKYIAQNIKTFLRTEPVIFSLIMVCISCTTIMALFSFGFYHQIEQKRVDDEYGELTYDVYFYDKYQWSYERKMEVAQNSSVRKGNLTELLFQLEDTLRDCVYIEYELMYPEDLGMEARMDLYGGTVFAIENGETIMSPLCQGLAMKMGRYFTNEEIREGKQVCVWDYWISDGVPNNPIKYEEHYQEENPELAIYEPTSEGRIMIGGKEYECIGNMEMGGNTHPEVPVTTVSDDVFVKRMVLLFSKPITRKQYERISEALYAAYGEEAMIQPRDIHETDAEKFYNTLLTLCISISTLSAIVVSFLYEYILLKRRKTLLIFQMCGMTKGDSRIIAFLECMLYLLSGFLTGAVFYHFILLSYLSRYFEYIRASYSVETYFRIGLVYLVTSGVIIRLFIQIHTLRKCL